ncbi:DUF1474 family protein [Staphylococcus pasteuri]|uniref:type II toxin-antitoxin system toxin TscT n=1 Tax=Staphylococcus pasteuri TaxID=45972 RepID=UPI001E53EB70|nr:DUF1474 family protein [Staphylococcus pasteuri]MCE3022728.1 DUF1474 family protein [Staphylococcus pasteuri]
MYLQIVNLFEETEIIKEKYEDLLQSFRWFIEDYFNHERGHSLTKDEALIHGVSYHEHRIRVEQFYELLSIYNYELSNIINRFNVLEKPQTNKPTKVHS